MNAETLQRYAPGGDIYSQMVTRYGETGARDLHRAAASGDPAAVNQVLTRLNYGTPMPTNTWELFVKNVAESTPQPKNLATQALVIGGVVLLIYMLVKK